MVELMCESPGEIEHGPFVAVTPDPDPLPFMRRQAIQPRRCAEEMFLELGEDGLGVLTEASAVLDHRREARDIEPRPIGGGDALDAVAVERGDVAYVTGVFDR